MNLRTASLRGALALGLATSIIGVAQSAMADVTIPYGVGSTVYSIANTSSSSSATVVAAYYPPGGNTAALTQNYNVPAHGRLDVTVNDPVLGASWQGSVVLSSDQDIVSAAMINYTGKPAYETQQAPGDQGTETSMYDAFNNGDTSLYVPLIQRGATVAATSRVRLASRYTIQNTTANAATVYLTYRTDTGTLIGSGAQVVTLQPYGSRTFQTIKDSDLPAVFTGRASITITSTQAIAGVVEQVWDNEFGLQNWSADYSMLTTAQKNTTLFSPQAQRQCIIAIGCKTPANGGVISNYNIFTSFSLQNTSPSATANVQMFLTPVVGNAATYSFQIAPASGYDVNLFNGGQIPSNAALWTTLGTGDFRGSVKFVSDQPLVGAGFIQQPNGLQNYASAYGLVSTSDATNKIVVPWFDRKCKINPCPALQPFTAYNSFTNLTIANLGAAAVNITAVNFYTATGGAPIATIPAFSLAAGGSYFINSRGGGDASFTIIQSLSTGYGGYVEVIADPGATIKGVVTINRGNLGADAYNAPNR